MSLENLNNRHLSIETTHLEDLSLNDHIESLKKSVETQGNIEGTDEGKEGIQDSKEQLEWKNPRLEKTEIVTDLEMTEGIADCLEKEKDFKFENWSKMPLEKRVEVLNKVEQKIASIEHRPPLTVMIEDMEPRHMGYHSPSEHKLVLNSKQVAANDPNVHREVVDTIIHEGRHAYQHYNVDVKSIHESAAEVESWRENFYDPQYGYYKYQGQKIMIPMNGEMVDIGFRNYYYQPVEIDARNFASDVMYKLEHIQPQESM